MARQRLHARCHKTNQSGARCKVLVPVGNALRFPRGRKLPFYCDAHQAEILADNAKLGTCSRVEKQHRLRFLVVTNCNLALIPRNLEPRTQVVLRHLADKPVADSDTAGYIYALELMGKLFTVFSFPAATDLRVDNARPDLIHIKVGRTNDIARRLREHRRNCPSFRPILLGHTAVAPYCDQLERLVHLELTDLAAQSYPPGRNAPRTCCQDCQYGISFLFSLLYYHR